MSRPESIGNGIAFDEETGTHAVVISSVIVGRYGTQLQALRALELKGDRHLGEIELEKGAGDL